MVFNPSWSSCPSVPIKMDFFVFRVPRMNITSLSCFKHMRCWRNSMSLLLWNLGIPNNRNQGLNDKMVCSWWIYWFYVTHDLSVDVNIFWVDTYWRHSAALAPYLCEESLIEVSMSTCLYSSISIISLYALGFVVWERRQYLCQKGSLIWNSLKTNKIN